MCVCVCVCVCVCFFSPGTLVGFCGAVRFFLGGGTLRGSVSALGPHSWLDVSTEAGAADMAVHTATWIGWAELGGRWVLHASSGDRTSSFHGKALRIQFSAQLGVKRAHPCVKISLKGSTSWTGKICG